MFSFSYEESRIIKSALESRKAQLENLLNSNTDHHPIDEIFKPNFTGQLEEVEQVLEKLKREKAQEKAPETTKKQRQGWEESKQRQKGKDRDKGFDR